MFRSFPADADVGDDRRSQAPAVRTVLGLLHRLSAGQHTDEHFASRARLLGGPFPGLRAEQPTLDRQLEVIALSYEIDAWADALTLSPDGRVLLTGVCSATRRVATGGFAEAFGWLFGCNEEGRIASMTVFAQPDLARHLGGFATPGTEHTTSTPAPDELLAHRVAGVVDHEADAAQVLEDFPGAAYLVDARRTIRHWNRACEEISGYSADDLVGHHCYEGFLRHVDDDGNRLCFGMCPLAHTIRDGRPRTQRVYLHHRDGHRVPVVVTTQPITDPGGRRVGAIEVFTDDSRQPPDEQTLEELRRRALADPVTGLPNRGFLEMAWAERLSEHHRDGTPLGVALTDVDGLGRVNERHGRALGDDALAMVARTLAANVGERDLVARWDGGTFALLTQGRAGPELTDRLERLRGLVATASLDLPGGDELAVTLSVGTTLASATDTLETALERAGSALSASRTP